MTGAMFRPGDPVRAVWDTVMGRHVLLVGTWHNEAGHLIGHEVCTMAQTRSAAQVREVLTPTAISIIPPEEQPTCTAA